MKDRFDRIVAALGELARPWVLYVSALSSSLATVSIVWMRLDLIAGAAFIAAAWAGTGALYGAKAWEKASAKKVDARIAEATGVAPPAAEEAKQ